MKKLTICIVWIMIATFAHADDIRQVSLATNDIIYDPFSRKIYASVPSSAGLTGNSIVSIDPYTGSVGPFVFVGSEPNKLAISDNGQYLYVGLNGAAAVRRFDIQTGTAGLQFSLGNDPYSGPYFVNDIEVLPGNPEAVAVSRRNSCCAPSSGSVAIYDNGVQRPTTPQYYSLIDVIEFSSSASRLYGYNNETTGYDFTRMSVDENGVSVVDVMGDLISGFNVDIKFDNGLIYATTGRVIDPEARMLVGTFTGFPTSGALVKPDSKTNRVFFLASSTLRGYQLDTFLPAGSLSIQGITGTASSLIRWGAQGLAFRSSGKVFMIRTGLIPPSQADFDGDGKTDIVWRHTVSGMISMWLMDGTSKNSSISLPEAIDVNWKLAGVRDFNDDRNPDIIWRHKTDGSIAIWLMDGTTWLSSAWLPGLSDMNWEIAGIGDFNDDGKPDLVWRQKVDGSNAVWLMDGTTWSSSAWLPVLSDMNWEIAGIGDFNNDSKPDLVWRHKVDGSNAVWLMDGTAWLSSAWLPGVSDMNWEIAGIGDFNDDTKPDIVWRNKSDGLNAVWLMDGTTWLSTAWIPGVTDPDWEIVGP